MVWRRRCHLIFRSVFLTADLWKRYIWKKSDPPLNMLARATKCRFYQRQADAHSFLLQTVINGEATPLINTLPVLPS